MVKITDKRLRFPRAKTWAAMTPEEQARHLVIEHGFDQDYFVGPENSALDTLTTNEAVEKAFVVGVFTDENTNGYSYPHPDGRNGWHESDHEQDAPFGGAPKYRHTHG